MEQITGRHEEKALLESLADSQRAEFVALYGRRRVGKTFLVNSVFRGRMTFAMTGVIDGNAHEQLAAFADAMDDYGLPLPTPPRDWMEAFIALKKALRPALEAGKQCVVFIDELPALDTRGSGVARALGYFWNQWASKQTAMLLIVCGSATSWMLGNIVNSHGGLHCRVTHEMHIRPFRLAETAEYLESRKFLWSTHMVLQAYMALGGVPYYLSLLDNRESLAQNLDRLFFSPDAPLRREYRRLLTTLFRSTEPYSAIIDALSRSRSGMTREQLSETLNVPNNGHLGDRLEALVSTDLVQRTAVREKRVKKTEAIFRLADFFCLFHLTFAARALRETDYWAHHINTPEVNAWLGLAFERVCLEHVPEIKRALRIDGISTLHYSWRSREHTPGAQVDIVIERADRVVNLCEVKYSETPYELTKAERDRLLTRRQAFTDETGLRHAVWLTMIAAEGMKPGKWNGDVQSVVTLNDLIR